VLPYAISTVTGIPLVDATHCWSSARAWLNSAPSSHLIRQLLTDAKPGAEPGFVLLIDKAKKVSSEYIALPADLSHYKPLNSSQTEKCHEIASDTGSGCAGQFRSHGENIVKIPRAAVTRICSWYQADPGARCCDQRKPDYQRVRTFGGKWGGTAVTTINVERRLLRPSLDLIFDRKSN
jgi:hypothetical protein